MSISCQGYMTKNMKTISSDVTEIELLSHTSTSDATNIKLISPTSARVYMDDDNKQPVAGVEIGVYRDNVHIEDIKTNEHGIVEVDFSTFLSYLSEKKNIKITFKLKDGYYAISKISAHQYAKEIGYLKALPSDLKGSVKFTDESGYNPNNKIDAFEESFLIVEVTNQGEGTAYNVKLIAETTSTAIELSEAIHVGNILPGNSKKGKIRLKANPDLDDGEVPVLITIAEDRGYDWKTKVLLPAARLKKPRFSIDYTINDSNSGLANGNGNGIPENGESVELSVFIMNQGDGDATGVEMSASRINTGIKWEKNKEYVGRIHPGETVKAKAGFSIPINFDADKIIVSLNLSDSRGISSLKKDIELDYRKLSPQLHYDYRIMSNGNDVSSVSNGDEIHLVLSVKNSGSLRARNVVMSLDPVEKVVIDRQKVRLGAIESEASLPARNISISVPRDYTKANMNINIALTQSDFPLYRDAIKIPVNIKTPKLTYVASLLSKESKFLQQGETAYLEITVLNEGDLKAEDVFVVISSNSGHLRVLGEKKHRIGSIPEKSASETVKYRVSATNRLKAGEQLLDISIGQKDFASYKDRYIVSIAEEEIDVLDFASGTADKKSIKAAKLPPTIRVLSPKTGEVIEEESIYLAALVTDYRKLENVSVRVNGTNIPLHTDGMKRRDIRTFLPLSEGSNTITVSSYNADNLSSEQTIIVTRMADIDVDVSPVIDNDNPDAVGVVIGISHYKNAASVDFAARDAKAVNEYLIHAFGYKRRNIINVFDSDATNAELRTIFEEKLAGYVTPGKSDLFVYYSGHGAPSTETKKPYIVPYDADPTYIKTQGYLLEKLYKDIDKLQARRVTVVIDSCFSGQSEKGLLVKEISPIHLDYENPAMQIRNGVVFTSSEGKQVSNWYSEKRHGLFTYYFLLGLRGSADTDSDRLISAGELESFLVAKVPEQSERLKSRKQTPTVIGNKDIVLLKY